MPVDRDHGEGFPREWRLLSSKDFRQVFKHRRRVANHHGSLHIKPNGLDHARLGITVSKKVSRRAVNRNRIKRLVREYFRKNNSELAGKDVIFTAFPASDALSNQEFSKSLDKLFARTVQRCAR